MQYFFSGPTRIEKFADFSNGLPIVLIRDFVRKVLKGMSIRWHLTIVWFNFQAETEKKSLGDTFTYRKS